MNLEKFLEDSTPDEGLSATEKRKAVGRERFIAMLAGKEKFDDMIELNTPDLIKDILKAIEDPNSKLSNLTPRSLKVKAVKVKSILSKIDKGSKIRGNEADFVDEFCDEIGDILMQETYMKAYFAHETGGSGGKVNKLVFNESFPIRLTTKEGKTYYGLVRPPTGVITWKGDEARKAVKEIEGVQIPKKLPLMQKGWSVMKNLETKKLFDSVKLEVRDDEESKKKVVKALKAAGASINERGDVKGVNRALDAEQFWLAIAKIFQ